MSPLHTAISGLSTKVSSTSTLGLNRLFSTSRTSNSCRGPQGKCGIPPLAKKKEIDVKKVVKQFPQHLAGPPCIPRGKVGRYPPICSSTHTMVCPREVLRYKFPAYSECCTRPHRIRYKKECCYFPPPPCEVKLIKPTE